MLGRNALPAYNGYNPNVNPAIATEFSTVAFRFGHSLLSGDIETAMAISGQRCPDVNGRSSSIPLSEDFFDPNLLNPAGVVDPDRATSLPTSAPSSRAIADGDAQAMDLLAINDVRNLLFANCGLQDDGQDLIARDIQRGRDDGIGDLQPVRVAYGLPAVTSFAQITSNVKRCKQELRAGLRHASNNIDAVRGRDGRGPRGRLRRGAAVPGDHGRSVHAAPRRRPLLLLERKLQPRRAEYLSTKATRWPR